MWQNETFDPEIIGRELKWASEIGMNSVRVFLHDLIWQADAAGFKSRIEIFLQLADAVGIRTMFVLFRRLLVSAGSGTPASARKGCP